MPHGASQPEPALADPGVCPRCGYSRAGLGASAPCPECGAAAGAGLPPRSARRDLALAAATALPVIAALALLHALAPERDELGFVTGAPAAGVRLGCALWLGAGAWLACGSRARAETPVASIAIALVVAFFGLVIIEMCVWLLTMILL